MGNSTGKEKDSFRKDSSQLHEYRALENKTKLLKIQASNYTGTGKDNIYQDVIHTIQQTLGTVIRLRDHTRNVNKKLEYDILANELQGCMRILSERIRHAEMKQNRKSVAEWNTHQQSSGDAEQWVYVRNIEVKIQNLFMEVEEAKSTQHLYRLEVIEESARRTYAELESVHAHELDEISSRREMCKKQLRTLFKTIDDFRITMDRRASNNIPQVDPVLQQLSDIEASLNRANTLKEVEDAFNILNTIKSPTNDASLKQQVLMEQARASIDDYRSRIQVHDANSDGVNHITDGLRQQMQRHVADIQHTAEESHDVTQMLAINSALKEISSAMKQGKVSGEDVGKIIQRHNSARTPAMPTPLASQLLPTSASFRSNQSNAAMKESLGLALERKGYRKTFLANTVIRMHAAKVKRSSIADAYDSTTRPASTSHLLDNLSEEAAIAQIAVAVDPLVAKSVRELQIIQADLQAVKERVARFNGEGHHSTHYSELEDELLQIMLQLQSLQNYAAADHVAEGLVFAIRDAQKVLAELDERAAKFSKIQLGY